MMLLAMLLVLGVSASVANARSVVTVRPLAFVLEGAGAGAATARSVVVARPAKTRARVAMATAKKKAAKGGSRGFGGGSAPALVEPAAIPPGGPPPPVLGASAEWAALRPWLAARGASVDGLAVGLVGDAALGLRGVIATRPFERGEPLFKIPRETAILDEAAADKVLGAVWEGKDVPACVRVALLVLHLQAADPAWVPALRMLPSRADFERDGGPLELWSAEQVSLCECPQLCAEVGARSLELRQLYADTLLPGWERAAASGKPLDGLAPPSFERVQWAVVAVSSRAYGEGPAGEGTSSMLVPGVDLCNHAPPAEANTAKALAPWGEFVVIAARAIAAGEEVCITYGPLPNRRLLQQFGFMLPAADRNRAQAQLEVAITRLDRLWPDSAREHSGEGYWADSLPEPARALVASLAATGALVADGRGRVSVWQPCGPKLAKAVAALDGSYAALLRHELGAYASGPAYEVDEARLADAAGGAQLEARERLALEFRAHTKRLLHAALADVGEAA